MLTLEELHNRFCSYAQNILKKQYAFVSHGYGLKLSENGEDLTQIKEALIASIIDPFENFRQISIYFLSFGDFEIDAIPELLIKYIEVDKFHSNRIRINTRIAEEDGRIMTNDQIIFNGKVFIETNELCIKKEEAYLKLNSLNIRYKDIPISFSIRDNNNWADMDKSKWTSIFLCHDSRDKKFTEVIIFFKMKNG